MTRIKTIAATVWLEMLRRKDIYVLMILLGALLVVLVSLDVFGLGGAARYIKDVGLLMAWFFSWILAVILGTRELPQEERNRTIYPLLAKPITRAELLVGKWAGCWTVTCAATLSFYALVLCVVAAKGGDLYLSVAMQGFLLHCAALAIVSAIGIAFSTRMNHDAASTITFILTAATFLVVPRIPEFMMKETGFNAGMLMFIYNSLPHFEFFDLRRLMVHDYPMLDWRTFCVITLYGITWVLCILLAAWLAYRNKRFSRGQSN